MNILVCSKISIPAKDRTLPAWEYVRSLGYKVFVEHPSSARLLEEPDVIISMGVTIMEETFEAMKRFPNAKLFCYNWDCYEWVWKNPRPGEYNYKRYGELLTLATEIWVPSHCTGLRTSQWWGLDHWKVILSACPYWEYDNVRDDGYALCALREIPDPWWGVFEECCEELKIPYKMSKHEQSYEDYQDIVAGCRFICAPLYELSTGGLTLMEAYYLGKPVLISNSKWNGGKDYFRGGRAMFFEHGDKENFKEALEWMSIPHDAGRRPGDSHFKDYISKEFSDERMMDDMFRRIEYLV